jgi:ribonuclease Y
MEISGTIVLLLGFNLIVGAIIGFFLRKKLIEGNQENVEEQGRQIIEKALHDAEQKKKRPCCRQKKRRSRSKRKQSKRLRIPGRRLRTSSADLTASWMKYRTILMI